MDDYLQELEEKQESPFDLLLVALTRMRLIGDEAVRPSWTVSQPSEQLRALLGFQNKALLSRLEHVTRALPERLAGDSKLFFSLKNNG